MEPEGRSAARDRKRARDEGECPRRHKSFAAGNGCSETKNYYVEPQVSELVDMLVKGSYCVLSGVRQSGKSTSALYVRKLLRNAGFECIYLDLPPHLPDTALSNAERWKILITAVSRRSSVVCAQPDMEPSDSAFSEMFFRRHEQKDVILIFDEMNTFGRLPLSFKDSFLATLRAMKLDEDSYCLHSILLIGTDSMLAELKIAQEKRWASTPDGCPGRTGFECSPFSHDFRMRPSFFSTKDIEDLLAQYEQDRLIKVEKQAIALSIFNLTSGHKGLVGVCCAELDAAFPLQSQRTLQMWERFSKQSLAEHVFVKPTYYAMISVCRGLDEKGRDLILWLLRAQGNVTVPYDRNVECLISDGVVVDNSPDTQLCELRVSSLLLHSALLVSLQPQLSIKVEPGPRNFDHLWVITKTIERLDWSIFAISESQNADQLASEYSIQFEFYVKLKAVLLGAYNAANWSVIPEAKPLANKRKRLDISVRDGERNRWFAVELLRQGTPRSLGEHYDRSKIYAATHECVVFMLNFILNEGPKAPSFHPPTVGDVVCYDVFGRPSARLVGGFAEGAGLIERPLNLVNDIGKLSLFSSNSVV